MPLDLTFINASQTFNFFKENWDEFALMCFSSFQLGVCIRWLEKRYIKDFLIFASVYVPTLVLLGARMLFNTSWPILTGFVVGSSLVFALWQKSARGENEYTDKTASNGFFAVMLSLSLLLG